MSKEKWLYRLESINPDNGLWYNSANEYVWGCKDCKGEAKNLPMGYDERYHIDGKNWFSSCSNKEDLLHWYSKEDAEYLIANGFVFTRYLARDYHEFDMETVFLKETALKREVMSFIYLKIMRLVLDSLMENILTNSLYSITKTLIVLKEEAGIKPKMDMLEQPLETILLQIQTLKNCYIERLWLNMKIYLIRW